jgi:hypothetical protein
LEEKVKETPFSRFFFGGEPIKLNVKCNLGVDIMIYNDKSISKHHGSIRTDPMAVEKLVLLQDMCKRDINIYFVLPPPRMMSMISLNSIIRIIAQNTAQR